jgi:hypothetical protein
VKKTFIQILITEQGSLSRKKLETIEYQDKYAERIQIVEPVFANIRYCKGLNRFTLSGERESKQPVAIVWYII